MKFRLLIAMVISVAGVSAHAGTKAANGAPVLRATVNGAAIAATRTKAARLILPELAARPLAKEVCRAPACGP